MNESYHDTPEPSTKTCTQCHIEKALTDFYRESVRKDGHKTICKACLKLSYRANAYGEIIVSRLVQLPLSFETKVCNICKEERPLSDFARGAGKDGLQYRCKECQNKFYRKSKGGQLRASKKAAFIPQVKGNKICRNCLMEKPLSDFFVYAGSNDKHASQCKKCVSHQMYVVNREQSLERMRNHYANNKEDYQANMRKWREENKEQDREAHRRWAQEHPLQCRELSKRRKVRKRDATVGKVDYDLVIEQYGFICHICNKEIMDLKDLHMDHVVPLARGGAHAQGNLLPSHGVCNQRKYNKLMEELSDYDRRGPDA